MSQQSHTQPQPQAQAPWRLIAQQEVTSKLRDKTFLGGAAFMLILIVAMVVLGAFLGGRTDTFTVAVTGDQTAHVVKATQQVFASQPGDDTHVSATSYDTAGAARTAVTDGDVDAALLRTADGFQVLGKDEVDSNLNNALKAAVAGTQLSSNAQAQGVDLQELRHGTKLEQNLLNPDASNSGARKVVAIAFAMLFYMTAMVFGLTIAQSVVREKESRVVEILAAAVPIRALLWGKIVGNTLLALGQIVLLVAVGLGGLVVTGHGDLLAGVGPAALWYVLFFVLGFVALASLWSVAGALATRQEDLQTTTMPAQILLIVPFLISFTAGAGVQTVMSMLPIVSTMTMPGRIAQGDVPLWQILVSIAITVAAAAAFVRVGTRLYERTLLQTNRRISYREAFRSAAQ